jgi:excisionase family DNA binding protein
MPPYSAEAEAAAPSILLRPEEVARMLRVSRSAVYALLASGELQSFTIGRRRRIPRSELDKYVARRVAEAPTWGSPGIGD